MDAFVGLISGTSADGVDAALVSFEPDLRVLAFTTHAYPTALAERLRALGQDGRIGGLDEFGALDADIAESFAESACWAVAEAARRGVTVQAIGSHGQTVRHRPHATRPFTLQMGDPNVIAERTGHTTVADFRRRDIAAGGQGAPLLPALHAGLFTDPAERRAVLNLGGIANLTLLLPGEAVIGFDTGPANGLLDAWCLRHTGKPYDAEGRWAASGAVQPALLRAWASDPWFALPAPKSTGRDQFHLEWADRECGGLENYAPEDVQASLLALSAQTICGALTQACRRVDRLLVCGGGVHNTQLMQALAKALPETRVESTSAHGLNPDAVEAAGFAWLARETLAGRPGNLPSVTGARGPRVLGCIYPA
ncbi:MAG: anhydro-N-acetylmuramic acid kinase [Xanthomonadales bacterium]|nr:anhydro-N-acetylmuramic acid kinase [Xanthomonadales bacterium]